MAEHTGTPREVDAAGLDGYAGSTVVVDFWAPWCGPCRAYAPVFAASAAAHPQVPHLKVNVDENQDLAARFGVMSIPMTLVIRDGEALEGMVGAVPAARLAELVALASA